MHDLVTNNERITIPAGAGGLYDVEAQIAFAANATGYRQVSIVHSSGSVLARILEPEVSAAAACILNPATTCELAAGDYITVVVHHTAGVALNVLAASAYSPEFMATLATGI
jgi:hypothetical protein